MLADSASTHLTRALAVAVAALLGANAASAQSDYYNTDTGRPIRIEDAYATERFSLDAHLAPVTVERVAGRTAWSLDPEIAYGLLPRTQIELGVPVAYRDAGQERKRVGVAGIDLSALYNFNAETGGWPALAVRAGTTLPIGRYAPENPHTSLQGMATRTLRWARFHANAAYTFGDEPVASSSRGSGGSELTRWTSGVAVDRTFPLRSLLVAGEVYASQPLADEAADPAWTAGAGVRYQLTPYYALDGGLARRLTGDEQGWSLTFGVARVIGVRVLPRGIGRWGR